MGGEVHFFLCFFCKTLTLTATLGAMAQAGLAGFPTLQCPFGRAPSRPEQHWAGKGSPVFAEGPPAARDTATALGPAHPFG